MRDDRWIDDWKSNSMLIMKLRMKTLNVKISVYK